MKFQKSKVPNKGPFVSMGGRSGRVTFDVHNNSDFELGN